MGPCELLGTCIARSVMMMRVDNVKNGVIALSCYNLNVYPGLAHWKCVILTKTWLLKEYFMLLTLNNNYNNNNNNNNKIIILLLLFYLPLTWHRIHNLVHSCPLGCGLKSERSLMLFFGRAKQTHCASSVLYNYRIYHDKVNYHTTRSICFYGKFCELFPNIHIYCGNSKNMLICWLSPK